MKKNTYPILTKEFLYNRVIVQRQKIKDIAAEVGCDISVVFRRMKKLGIKRTTAPIHLLAGKRCGNWSVLEKKMTPRRNGGFKVAYLCECTCGKRQIVQAHDLIRGATIRCKTCANREISRNNRKGYEEISSSFWRLYRSNAKRRKLAFELTIEEAWLLFQQQDGRCALTGSPLSFAVKSGGKATVGTASLDRIDSLIGYTKNNVQWVHRDINKIKWSLPEPEFISLCKAVCEWQNNGMSVAPISENDVLRQWGTNEGPNCYRWTGYKGITGDYWSKVRGSARKRNIPFTLTLREAWDKFLLQGGRCFYTGCSLILKRHGKSEGCASLDRTDSSSGYSDRNVRWVDKRINLMKNNLERSRFVELCGLVAANNG